MNRLQTDSNYITISHSPAPRWMVVQCTVFPCPFRSLPPHWPRPSFVTSPARLVILLHFCPRDDVPLLPFYILSHATPCPLIIVQSIPFLIITAIPANSLLKYIKVLKLTPPSESNDCFHSYVFPNTFMNQSTTRRRISVSVVIARLSSCNFIGVYN